MASATELDAQWEAQYLVVKQKNDERNAALRALAADPVYQNASAAEQARLLQDSSAEAARLAFNTENQKLTAIKKELDLAKAKESGPGGNGGNTTNDAQGRSIPVETGGGTELNSTEQANLDNTGTAGTPTTSQTNINVLSAILKEDKASVEAKVKSSIANEVAKVENSLKIGGLGGAFLPGSVVGENPLHACASYTYNMSMHVLTPDDFKLIMESPSSWAPSVTLIGGAGRQANRHPEWREDFYIDNLEMESTVGPSDHTKSSNAFHFKFTIIEPLGMTLLNRILRLNDQINNGVNWTQIPYVLEISFNGYGDNGEIMDLSNHTKYFPMKIYNMGIKPGLKGTEYNCEATPYVHEAYSSEIGAAPASFESEARTLEDFFRLDEKSGVNSEGRPTQTDETFGGEKEKTYKVRSFVSAYNKWAKKRVDNNDAEDYDEIEIIFADEILKGGKIVSDKTQPAPQSPSPDRKREQVAGKQATGEDPGGPKQTAGKFAFAAGTHITAIIDMAMQSTEYWRKQFADYTQGNEKDAKPKDVIRGWKIVPKVTIKKFDTKRGRFALKLSYYVKVHVKYNREDPNAPKSWPVGIARTYQYQYTGQNRDILQYEVKFDVAYTSKVLGDVNKGSATAGAQPNTDTSTETGKSANADGSYNVEEAKRGIFAGPGKGVNPITNKVVTDTPSATGANLNKDGIGMIAANAYDNLFIKSAELCKADITIIGDPCFIPQEEVFYSPSSAVGNVNEPSSEFVEGSVMNSADPGNTLKINSGDMHCRILWKAATDLNEATGGYGGGLGGFEQVDLNGLYKIFYIKSTFAGGKFEQKLETTRLTLQEDELARENGAAALDIRELTRFPELNAAGSGTPTPSADLTRFKDQAPAAAISMSIQGTPASNLRALAGNFPTVTPGVAADQGIAAFGQRYDIPFSVPRPAVDNANLPVGVNVDPLTGLPAYKGSLYTGGQNDLAAWKQAVDEKQKFSYAVTRANGNTGVDSYTPA